MVISRTAEYALRAIVFLGVHEGKSVTAEEVSRVTKVPSSYLSKVLQLLAKHGIVTSQRGLNGGFCLTRPTKDVCLLEVINAVDTVRTGVGCPLNIKAHKKRLCPLHRRLLRAVKAIEKEFEKTFVSDLVLGFGKAKPFQ